MCSILISEKLQMTDNVIVKYLGYKKQFSALSKNGIKSHKNICNLITLKLQLDSITFSFTV